MPYTKQTIPPAIKDLPEHAQSIWISAFNSAYDEYNDENKAFAVAWSAVKNQYEQVDGKWVKKEKEAQEPQFFTYPVNVNIFQEGETSEIKIIPTGYWKHPVYGDIRITEEDIVEFEKHFNQGLRNELPITEGHAQNGETKPAVGWFKKLINKGKDGLWALVEWTEKGQKLLKDKAYKYFSPEFYTTYEDPETRKVVKNVLVGGALVNKPYFKGLPAIVLSEQLLNPMDIKEVLSKAPEELTDEEKDFLKENKESLSEEDLVKFGLKEETKEETKEEVEEPKEEVEEIKEEVKEASEKNNGIIMSEETLKILERKAEQGAKAMAELTEMKIKNFVDTLTFSEHNPEGVLYPKSSDKVVKFALSLSDDQLKAFKEIMAEMPKLKLFGEIGKDSGIPISVERQFDELVKAKQQKDVNLTYREAVEQVSAENPELVSKLV